MFDRLKAAASILFRPLDHGLTIVSNWLANALWLIETKFIPLAREGYGANAAVYACLRLLSQSVPEPPMVAYQVKNDKRTKAPEDHPLVVLIRDPNELMTEYELWELATIHLGIAGRATLWKERDRAGRLIALWPMRPDRIGPIYAPADSPIGKRVLLGWSYQVPGTGQYVPLPREDVVFINFPNPFEESGGLVEGLGPLQVLAAEVSADNEATGFVGALVKNYAAPTTILKVKNPLRDEKTAELLKAKFRSEFGGARRGVPAIVDADTTIETLGFNLQQLEFPDLRDVAESRIAAGFGVPPGLVGLNVGLKRNTMANLQESRRYFAETTLANYWRRFADVWNRDVAPEFGEGLLVEFDTAQVKALAAQQIEKLQPIKDGFDKGIITVNQYREALQMDPLDPADGDVFYLPNAVTVVPASDQARKALEARKEQEQPALPVPPPVLALPPGEPVEEGEEEEPEDESKGKAYAAKLGAHAGHGGQQGPHRGHVARGRGESGKPATERITLSDGSTREATVVKHGEAKILVPTDLDSTKQALTADDVKGMIDQLPADYRGLIQEVRLSDIYYQGSRRNDGITASYNTDERHITFHQNLHHQMEPAELKTLLAGTMRHEAAHALTDKLGPDFQKAWKKAIKKDGASISDYAKTNWDEDVSETLKNYWSPVSMDRRVVKTFFPERHAVLQKFGVIEGGIE